MQFLIEVARLLWEKMNYAAIISETNEYEFYVVGASEDDILGILPAINPNITSENFFLKRGPIQVQVNLKSLSEVTHGQPNNDISVSIPLLPYNGSDAAAPVSVDPVYTTTVRVQRAIGYEITVNSIDELSAVLQQLNPSVDVLPSGVSILIPLQDSTVQPVVCKRPDGSFVNLYY